MKKYFIIVAAALVGMAACSKVNSLEVTPAEKDAVGFSAYTSTAVTKGSVQSKDPIVGYYDASSTWVPGSGIGVFAFYQPAVGGSKTFFNSKKYATPDFMYNQKVEHNNSDLWVYAPIKYWPNNTNDQVSFFAYAPYDPNKTWEDMGISTDINAKKLTISYPIQDLAKDQQDFLLAEPQINKVKPNVADSNIVFAFKHALSQINLYAGAITDATGSAPVAFPQPSDGTGTVITIDKVEFKGLAEKVTYVYNIAADGTMAAGTPEIDGSQDIILTAKNDFENNTSAVWTDNNFHKYNKSTSVMFVAPQTLGNIVITYTVKTTDKLNPANNSEITNVITTSDLSSVTLEAGKAYNINFLLGMTSVKVKATVADWEPATDNKVDVPANTAS